MIESLEEPPFEVEEYAGMIVKVAGVRPGTVLVLDQQLYNWRIKEYTEPLSYGRNWDYETQGGALSGLAHYLATPAASEPVGWVRCVDFVEPGHRYRMRRGKVEDGVWTTREIREDE